MAETGLHVTLCWSGGARHVQEMQLLVPDASSVETVLQLGLAQLSQQLALACVDKAPDDVAAKQAELAALHFQQPGIWGRRVLWTQRVVEGDRIELYRPLKVDPKVARRQRFKGQGKGRTGLFAKRKSGSAAGY